MTADEIAARLHEGILAVMPKVKPVELRLILARVLARHEKLFNPEPVSPIPSADEVLAHQALKKRMGAPPGNFKHKDLEERIRAWRLEHSWGKPYQCMRAMEEHYGPAFLTKTPFMRHWHAAEPDSGEGAAV